MRKTFAVLGLTIFLFAGCSATSDTTPVANNEAPLPILDDVPPPPPPPPPPLDEEAVM